MKLLFPAMQGQMGGRDYYATIVKLAELLRLLTFRDWDELPPEQRAQRILTKARIPDISRYLLEHADNGWIFSSITASYKGDVVYLPTDTHSDLGILQMDASATVIVNDGQHRLAAIRKALHENPEIGRQTMSLLLFPYESLERTQQMFSDLNRSARPTSKSLNVLFDHMDQIGDIAKAIMREIDVFNGNVDMERVSLPLRSPKLTTLSALYDSVRAFLLGRVGGKGTPTWSEEIYKEKRDRAIEYFSKLASMMPVWQKVATNALPAREARAEYVCCHAIILRALGLLGHELTQRADSSSLEKLKDIDWRRVAQDDGGDYVWEGKCLSGGDIVNNLERLRVTADYLIETVTGQPSRRRSADRTAQAPAKRATRSRRRQDSGLLERAVPRRGKARLRPPRDGELFRFVFAVNASFIRQSNHPITMVKDVLGRLRECFPDLGLHCSQQIRVIDPEGTHCPGELCRSESGAQGQKTEYWQLRMKSLSGPLRRLQQGDVLEVAAQTDADLFTITLEQVG